MRIHVLSNVNLAPLVPRITGHEVTLGDYGDVLRTLTDPNTDFVAEVLMVLLDGDELMDWVVEHRVPEQWQSSQP